MWWEGIVHTIEPSVVLLDTFLDISLEVVIFSEDSERGFINLPLFYEYLIEGREIMYAVRS